MTETGESPSSDEEAVDQIEASLRHARQDSTRFMNRVRFILVTAFVFVYAIGLLFFDLVQFRVTAWIVGLYWIGAGLVWFWSRRNLGVLRLSRFAIPVVDMPMVTVIQTINLAHMNASDSPHASAVFTLSVFIFLTVMSSFSMRSQHLYASAAVGIVCMLILAREADLPPITYFSSPIMILGIAWMMSRLPRRQTALIRKGAERKARRDRLARHFSPGVAELIESHDEPGEGEDCELSVLFCDIRGFTQISETLAAREVVGLLNEFHGTMVDAIFRYGGTLDKYLGDGLLAYFNAPARQPDHAERAVRCALAMIEDLEKFNRSWVKDGADPIRVGIGIHSGKAVVGEIGAKHRREFTAIGDTVNVGSRLQGLTKNYESDILVSELVVRQIKGAEALNFESVGSVAVRGRKQEVEVFVPVAEKESP